MPASGTEKELHRSINKALLLLEDRTIAALASFEAKKAAVPERLFLPGFDIGAMPNHLNRSSLIAPIARGPRIFHKETIMVTRKECVLEYTGEQLDEADGDLIMALIFYAQPSPFGTPVLLNRKKLLRKIKNGVIGSAQYAWLHSSIKRLTASTLYLQVKKEDGSGYAIGKTESFRIISQFLYDDETETYSYILDPRWVQMFSNKEYSLLDWNKRMQIGRGQNMAKTLQRLVATSSNKLQYFPIQNLKKQMQYTGRERDFKSALLKATRELERLKLIKSARIAQNTRGEEQLTIQMRAVA